MVLNLYLQHIILKIKLYLEIIIVLHGVVRNNVDRYNTEVFRSLPDFHRGFRIFHFLSTSLNGAYPEAEFGTLYLKWRQEADPKE